MRAGVREFLPSPLAQDSLLQAFNRYIAEKVRTHRHTQTRAKRGKVYCIMSAKHGSGATTVAVNVAGIIAARSGQRTALDRSGPPSGRCRGIPQCQSPISRYRMRWQPAQGWIRPCLKATCSQAMVFKFFRVSGTCRGRFAFHRQVVAFAGSRADDVRSHDCRPADQP